MTTLSSVDPDVLARERDLTRLMSERYVTVALRGLEHSLTKDRAWFCFKAVPGAGPGGVDVQGVSERYTTMSLLGLQRQSEFGRSADVPFAALLDNLVAWARTAPVIGDIGLVLWLCALRRDARADELAKIVVNRQQEVLASGIGAPSMEVGYLLIGVAEAERFGIGGNALRKIADDVAEVLSRNRDEHTHLFAFANKVRRKNFLRVRVDSRLGSFASQVYPTMGFAFHARACGDPRSARIARDCADRICALQGDAGQWWWIYNVVRGAAAVRYPVYSVHQDAMGPMMLTAAELGGGFDPRYDRAIEKSFRWFEQRPELPRESMIDDASGMIWRAVQHDDPRHTERLGLSPAELSRMGFAAWFGSIDERPLTDGGYVCRECRPYHLGWVLLADAMYRDCLAQRAGKR